MIVRSLSNCGRPGRRLAGGGQVPLATAPGGRQAVEEAVDVLVEDLALQPVGVVAPVLPHRNESGVVEDLDVVRDSGLGDGQRLVEDGAGELVGARDHAHYLDPDRLAE